MMQNASERYAKYVCGTCFEELSPEAVDQAKLLIMDSIGCILGAVRTEPGRAYLRLAREFAGKPESTLMGDIKVQKTTAAFTNSQLANLLDFDDTYDFYNPVHVGCKIVPASVAVGEALGVSGRDLIKAVVLAYETSMRVGRALGSINWCGAENSLVHSIGPAVATASLLRMDQAKVRSMFDILTVDTAFGLGAVKREKQDVPPDLTVGTLKAYYGRAAELGIQAAYQAKHRLTGMKGILDLNFTEWYLAGLPAEGFEYMTHALGEEFRILDMSFKPAPSCRWGHAALTAAWDALDQKPVQPDRVTSIVIRGGERLNRVEWKDMLDAQFSLPCTLALGITGVEPGPDWYIDGRFLESDIRQLAGKVVFESNPAAEAQEILTGFGSCEVEITMDDGTVRTAVAKDIKGSPRNPMTMDEHRAKFAANAGWKDAARIDETIDTILSLEQAPELGPLMDQLAGN
ncbi:MAG: MmgE/PrpD family protein [Anaerolineales bacterium]|nr:MmgE/PrpD family protein [Anaerolineales bacterium]